MLLVYASAAEVMVKLVQNDKGVHQYVTVEH